MTVQVGSNFSAIVQKDSQSSTYLSAQVVTDSKGINRLAVENAVGILAEHALANTVTASRDAEMTIESIIAEIDRKLSEQINQIIHHADFQQLEGAWRGLHYLIKNTETDELLKIRVMCISKKDLGITLKRHKGIGWDQSPIFEKIYEEVYSQFGGEPYGCLVGDYHFDHSPPDVEMLRELSRISASAHSPFIAGASPTVMQMDSWQELANHPRDLTTIFSNVEYMQWRSLRESEDSRYIGLAMPRFLARLPYGARTNPVDEFDFEEDTDSADHRRYTWANSAYAMAVNINRSFKDFGWCASIRGVASGGIVEDLPCHTFPTDDGGVDTKCPTEIAIYRREAELAKNGFMPLSHRKHSDQAAFIGAQSLQKPIEYADVNATVNAIFHAGLPYMFACCRFAHYLKCIVRDKIGSFRERKDMERWLNDWIMQYVDGDPADPHWKAKKPLAAAEIHVDEIAESPGYYTAKFFLRPQYQLEGLTVSLCLVSKLPSIKKAEHSTTTY